MVSHRERLRVVEQAVAVQGLGLERCRVAGRECATIAEARGYHSIFGPGDAQYHTLGKIGEMGFGLACETMGIYPDATPFPIDGVYHLGYDFAFGKVLVDCKGAWVLNEAAARSTPYKSFGMMVPCEKIRDGDASDVYVYCLCWDESPDVYRVAPVGWASRDEVKRAPVRNNVRHTCYLVPMSELHPMSEFYDFVKTGGA